MRRVLGGLCLAWVVAASNVMAQPGDLIERTLALVGTQVITLSDARAAIRLGLVEAAPGADPASVTPALVDRELILREVQRYAPPPPSEAAVAERMAEVVARLPGPNQLAQLLDETGFTESRLRAWVRDDLRTVAYLAQRFASASAPTESEVSSAFTRDRAEFDGAGLTFEQAAPIVRERLVTLRRRELIADWVSDLRRRTEVMIVGK